MWFITVPGHISGTRWDVIHHSTFVFFLPFVFFQRKNRILGLNLNRKWMSGTLPLGVPVCYDVCFVLWLRCDAELNGPNRGERKNWMGRNLYCWLRRDECLVVGGCFDLGELSLEWQTRTMCHVKYFAIEHRDLEPYLDGIIPDKMNIFSTNFRWLTRRFPHWIFIDTFFNLSSIHFPLVVAFCQWKWKIHQILCRFKALVCLFAFIPLWFRKCYSL